ncbi:hypothetical protein [Sphingomonas sp. PR090111-T3T-6A]|uniref:hypothetical protein n=1 Tax=Sphingomonas sp. PR090111-T3T-6A TaxID=685778 RepID=UPI000370C985|nr:hypothetical protein [Sphingomonas sp. PR090111-T3T-6A]
MATMKQAVAAAAPSTRQRIPSANFQVLDPLEADAPTDTRVPLSTRQICRLATIASETGARFARDRLRADALAWLYAPRELFSGQCAIDACVEIHAFKRALVLHGLSLGLDASPDEIDDLLEPSGGVETFDELLEPSNRTAMPTSQVRRCQLFTATILDESERGTLQAFVAVVADDAREVFEHLRDRYGTRVADLAVIRAGFDPSEPIAMALVSEAVGDALTLIARKVGSPLAAGVDVQLESRFLH